MNAPSQTPRMFPVMLDITAAPVVLVGGDSLAARLDALAGHGATSVHVFAAKDSPALAAKAPQMIAGLPGAEDFRRLSPQLVFIADVDDGTAEGLRALAKTVAGALVHVQDRIPLCDFHMPAIVRRGHLQVTVSTDGQAAGLSRLIRQYLEAEVFGPEWGPRVDEAAAVRAAGKAQGLGMAELADRLAALVAARGWLQGKKDP